MPRDPFVREKFTRERTAAKKLKRSKYSQNRCDDFSARSQRGAKRKPWSRRALGAAEQTKQKRAIGGIDGLQPVFYRLTAAPIVHARGKASHRARAHLLIEPIDHINGVL